MCSDSIPSSAQFHSSGVSSPRPAMSDLNRDLLTAVNAGRMEAVRALLQNPSVDPNKHESLHWAVTFGKVEMAKILVEHGANVNKHGMAGKETPLIIALTHSQPELVAYLLEHGADPNIPSKASKKYPLSYAYTVTMIELLLKYGADVNISTASESFLISALPRNFEAFKKLLEAGANVNEVDKDGYTPLIMAVEQGNNDVVKVLLQYGADIEVRGPSGRSVFEIASKPSTKKILESHRPAPIPITKLSSSDRVVEPMKVVDPSSPPVEAPQKHKSWIGRMFGKGVSSPSPTQSEPGPPPQEGLFARHKRAKASGLSPEEWCAKEAERHGVAPTAVVAEEETAYGTTAHRTADTAVKISHTTARATEPPLATAYVAPVVSSASTPNINNGSKTAAISTTATQPTVDTTERVGHLEARVLKLEKVVEEQVALIAKLLKMVDTQCSPKSDV